jgi:PST family polysaccharide transporter
VTTRAEPLPPKRLVCDSYRVSRHLAQVIGLRSSGLIRLAVSTGWLMIGYGARLIIGLLVGLYVARYLGPEAYGTLNYAVNFSLLFAALAQFGLTDVVVRDLTATPKDQNETLAAALHVRLATGALAVGFAVVTAWAHTDPTLRLMIMIVAVGMMFESLDLATPWFRSQVDARPTVMAGMIAMGAASTSRVVLVVLGMPVGWFAWPVLLDTVVRVSALAWCYLQRGGPRFRALHLSLPRVGALLGRAWPLALSAGIVMIQQRIDQVMLGILRGPMDVGWYAAAVRLSEVWCFVPYAVAISVSPSVVRAYRGAVHVYQRRLQLLFGGMMWLGVAIALPAAFLAGPLIELLYGAAYAQSKAVLQIHCWTIPLVALNMAWGRWIVAEGRHRIALTFALVALGSNILLNCLMIPAWGATGAAWATLSALALPLLFRFIHPPTRPVALLMLNAAAAPLVIGVSLLRELREGLVRL